MFKHESPSGGLPVPRNVKSHASENAYDRGSAVHEIFRAVDADYTNLSHGFCCARNHAYGLTRKGDREYFLGQQ